MKNKLLSQLYESCKKWKTLVLLGAMLLIGTGQMWADDLDFDGNSYIFIKNIKPDGWSWGKPFIQGASDEKDYLYVWGNNSANGYTSNATLVDGTACAENAIYAVKMPSGNYYGLKLARGNSINISSTWNATGDMYFNTGKNYLKKYGNSYEWDTYVPTSTASLSATSTSITTVQTSTLTPSLSSNEAYNEIKSTSYEVTTNPGSAGTVTSGGVFSATAAGTYTVTATVTYNAKGFSGITETTTATKNITVAAGVDTYAVVGNGSSDFGTAWLGQTDWGTAMTYSLSGTPLSRTFTGCKKSTNDGNQYYNFRILKNSAYQDADNCDQANSNISLSKNGNNVKFNIRWKADVTISYTPATKKAAVNVDESSYIADNYYLQGSITGWADGSPGTFTKVGGSLAYIKMTNASANHQFKITNQNAGYEMEMDTSFRANALGDIEIGNNGTNMNIASSGTYYIVIKLPCAETGYRHKVYATETSPVCTTPTIAWSTAPEDGTAGGSMTATVTTNQTSPTITWNSSNTSAATVNSSGVISYVAAGSTRITASYTGDGSTYCSTTASVYKDITVSAPTYYTVTYGVDASGNGTLAATYTSGGSSIGASPATVASGSGLTFTATPDSHYKVEGWYTDAACTLGKHDAGSTTYTVASLGSALNVYVKFELIDYTITYKDQGGGAYSGSNSGSLIASYNFGTGVATLVAGEKTGYTFGGWYDNSSCTEDAVTSIADDDSGNKTLYAKWTAKTYTVNFDQQSGTGGSTSVTATFGSAMPDATMPTRSGFDFGGYYSEADGGGTIYYNANGTSARSWDIDTNNTTLYAYWVPEATWYLMGDDFGGWGRSTSYSFNHNYRGIARVYYREVAGPSNNCFKIHDGTVEYGYPGGADQIVTINGDAYTYTHTGTYYSFRRTIPSGTTVWFVINTNNSTLWIMSPLKTVSVTSVNGTVTMSATDAKTSQTVTGTQFASGETVTIVVTPESGYQISSVSFGGDPIDADSENGYAKTYSVTMPSSDAELEVVYEEIPPEWKMYNGATLLGTFTGSGPYTAIINHTAGNSSNQYFELNGTAYQLAADCQLTSEQTLSTGSTQHAWTTDDYGYYRVSISTPDEGSTWKVQATRVYAVTYDGNGNTSGTAPANQYYAVGETIITATKGDLGKDDLHFYRWNTAADGSGNHYAESASAGTMTSSGLNLYAEWENLTQTKYKFKGGIYITGDDWEVAHAMNKKTGHSTESVVYYTASIESTNTGDDQKDDFGFKIDIDGTLYGLQADGESWYWNRSSSGAQELKTSGKNVQIRSDMAGDYEIKVDYSDEDHPTVEVIFPVNGNYNVTLSAGSHGSVANEGTLTIHEFPKVAISATPEPGYRFTGWTVDGAHADYIDFDDENSASTNVQANDPAAAGATITANFSNDGFVYFDRSAVKDTWSGDKVYVTYFTSASLSWDEGEGKTDGLIVKNWINDDVHNQEMTKIPNTSIYYFYTSHTPQGKILFTDKSHAGTDYLLWDMGAAVREDFNIGQDNMFVVENYNVKDKNKVGYCDGYWMKYNEDKAGISLKVYSGGGTSVDVLEDFELEIPGTRQFTATVTLSANTTYSISLLGGNGTWYNNDNSGTMESTNCTSWPFVDRQKTPGHITTTADGTYRFTLNCADKLYLTADYPLAVGDYQVVFNGKVAVGGTTEKYSSSVIRHIGDAGTKKDTLSFFVVNGDSWTMQLRRCTALSPTITWANVGDELNAENFDSPATGIYNFVVKQDSTAGTPVTPAFATMTPELYTGEYYIRSDAADGGWEAYKRAIDNKMIYSSFSQQHSGFDYYHCKYKGTGTNVKFCIANDYSARLSDTLYTDTHASTGEGVLPYQANIRFMWNSETNVCSRAYLNGSSDGTAEYLKIASNPGRTSTTSATKSERAEIVDKNGAIMLNNDTTFEDLGNWVYQIDLKALEGGRVKLTSDYRYGGVSHNQWFKGKDGDWSDANTEQIMGGDDNEYHLLRVIYDFKTNHMLSAWLVDQDANITGNRSVNADVLILRTGHEDAKQITFSGSGVKLDDVDTIYSAIELRKSHIFGSGSQASKEFYWVSFPYDVKISDIFGSVGNFNIDWAIQYYNGKKRAQNGFWSDSEPNWEFFMSNTETLKANEGYVLTLALRKFLKTGTGSKWDNGVDSLYLYFPSANKIGTILKKDTILKIDTVGYQCTIDRRTDKETPNIDKDRRVADSHWHCIGIPSFANSTRSTGSSWTTSEGDNSSITDEKDIPYIDQWTSPSLLFLYSWDRETNKLTPVTTSTYTFKAMHAYLVQYANDTIHWKAVSRPSKIVARQRAAVQSQEFRLEVRRNGVVEDQTFIHFSDEEGVTAGFEFGRDLSKEFNNNSANIYTFADYVPVAGNSMPLETEQTTVVPMGVKVAANGEYTIAMPEGTNGIGVVLVDNVAGTRTNLGLTDYTISLSAGQYNGRFVLEVSPIMHTPTGIEEVAGEGAQGIGARKVLIDGVMYIVRDGKIFDARGNRVK